MGRQPSYRPGCFHQQRSRERHLAQSRCFRNVDERRRPFTHTRDFDNRRYRKYRDMKIPTTMSLAAFTLVEMLVSVACSSIILAAVVTAGVALQRSFAAVEAYSISEGDQLRVQDYIAMDCRRATTAL